MRPFWLLVITLVRGHLVNTLHDVEDYGFCCVIAGSFSDIHYNNELKNGMLPIVQPLEVVKLAALLQVKKVRLTFQTK